MNKALYLLFTILLSLGTTLSTLQADLVVCKAGHNHLPTGALDPVLGRKYARNRHVDILHLKLDVTPNFTQRSIAGNVDIRFKPIALPLSQLELDAVDLNISAVSAEGAQISEYQVTRDKLILNFNAPILPESEVTVHITYSAQPDEGLYFRTPEMGYLSGDTQIWSQGEAELHRLWFPCYDYPNERFTSEVICHVPKGMQVISNGTLQSERTEADGRVAFHWLQDKPHVNYLIALAAGYFYKLEDKAGTLPLAMLVPPSHALQASNAFADTRKIIEFYQKEIGVPFPWDKYWQVYCLDFTAGGMENTSCTFEAAGMLFNTETEELRTLDGLDAHETAHQWFGDLVTCRDWSHLWLNEGFASYYTVLYEEHKNGSDAMKLALWREAEQVIGSNDTRPVVWRDYSDPMQQFDSRAYPKGAWILHMLRSQLGPDLYRRCIRTYLERHRNGIVNTDDLQDVIEEISGLSFDQFFDQWLHHGGVPELKIDYSWDAAKKLSRISVRQTQKVTEQVRLFHLPLPVSFVVAGRKEPIRFTLDVSKESEDFYLPLPVQPELVRIDPEFTVLAKMNFTPSGPMLDKQLQSDVIGRLLAVRALDSKRLDTLKKIIKEDPSYAVRNEAVRILAEQTDPESRTALIAASTGQKHSKTRLALVQALASQHTPESREALWKLAHIENNPLILAAIIETWGTRPGEPIVRDALFRYLAGSSYQNVLEQAAIRALRAQDDSTAVPSVLARLQTTNTFRAGDLGRTLESLAFLARKPTHPQRDNLRTLFTEKLTDTRSSVREAAARALGALQDPKALAVLDPIGGRRSTGRPDPLREAAAKSARDIRAGLDSPSDLRNLWERLQQLQRKGEDQQKEIEGLKKKPSPTKK